MGRISGRRLKRRNRTAKIWISVITLVLVGVFSVRSYSLYTESKEEKKRLEQLQAQKEKEEERTRELENEEKYRQTKKYIEDYAHNYLGLVYPGEIIFKTQK